MAKAIPRVISWLRWIICLVVSQRRKENVSPLHTLIHLVTDIMLNNEFDLTTKPIISTAMIRWMASIEKISLQRHNFCAWWLDPNDISLFFSTNPIEKSFVFVRSVLVGGPLPTLPPSAPSPQIEKYGGSAMQVGVVPCISNVTLLWMSSACTALYSLCPQSPSDESYVLQ